MNTASRRKKILVVIGTRPEAIKLAPIVLEAQKSGRFDVCVVRTSQHREMLDQMVKVFDLEVSIDLNIMRHNQTLCDVTTSALEGLHKVVVEQEPDCVVVQGDTTTTFCGALAAFYENIPVAHVEAGLRTYDRRQPFPEEVNRVLTTQLADFHFSPTQRARENLLKEGIATQKVWVTGNTAIDALHILLKKLGHTAHEPGIGRMILVTAHRRENQGEPLVGICRAVLRLVEAFPDVRVVFPVHLSPNVGRVVYPLLENHDRIELVEPLDYRAFVLAMNGAHLILTDSGGVQEEAPSLDKPVLILREVTERPEVVDAGAAIIVGTDEKRIVEEASRLLNDAKHYASMSGAVNPFGDGTAARQILEVLANNV